MRRMRASSMKKAAALREMAGRGLSLKEAHAEIGGSYAALCQFCKRHGITLVHELAKRGQAMNATRVDAMASMYRSGATLQQIGDCYGLTRERVRQLLTKHAGIRREDGGQAFIAAARREERARQRERECQEKYGCSRQQLAALQRHGKRHMDRGGSWNTTPIGAFHNQRSNARARGIEWNLTLWEWWSVWQQSGKWGRRGRTRDAYVMCRVGDIGSYERGNVYISTVVHNSSIQPNNPYRSGHPDHKRVWEELAKRAGTRRTCSVSGCDNRHFGRGLCNKHYHHFVTVPARKAGIPRALVVPAPAITGRRAA